jgi:hypothetical protein
MSGIDRRGELSAREFSFYLVVIAITGVAFVLSGVYWLLILTAFSLGLALWLRVRTVQNRLATEDSQKAEDL